MLFLVYQFWMLIVQFTSSKIVSGSIYTQTNQFRINRKKKYYSSDLFFIAVF